jgi:hypothetical protein
MPAQHRWRNLLVLQQAIYRCSEYKACGSHNWEPKIYSSKDLPALSAFRQRLG